MVLHCIKNGCSVTHLYIGVSQVVSFYTPSSSFHDRVFCFQCYMIQRAGESIAATVSIGIPHGENFFAI